MEARTNRRGRWWRRPSAGPEGKESSGPAADAEPSFELRGQAGTSLVLRPSRPGHLLAELEAAGLRSQRSLRTGAEFELAAFLEALRAPAWLGERWLESSEGELFLAATNEGSGDVRLTVQLRSGNAVEPWLAEARLRLRQSDLEQSAERVRVFLQAISPGSDPTS